MANITTSGKITIPGLAGTAYTAADALGTRIALTNVPARGKIVGISVTDLADQGAAFDMVLFDADITSGTDHDAYDMADADAPKYIGHIAVVAGDYSSFNDNSVASQKKIDLGYLSKDGLMFAQCVVRATPTYATSDLVFELIYET